MYRSSICIDGWANVRRAKDMGLSTKQVSAPTVTAAVIIGSNYLEICSY
jgi:hypothetical protein